MRLMLLAGTFACAVVNVASAQSLSVEDLQKQIDAEMTRGSEYSVLLNDPDPARALAAMKVMMASGDPELIRIAADYGLYSANPAVRAEALKAFLATKPRIDAFFTEAGSDGDFRHAMKAHFSSEPNASGVVATTLIIGSYDPENDCYAIGAQSCGLQVRPEAILIGLDDIWNEITLTKSASLEGSVNLGRATNVPMRLQLR